MNTSNWRPVLMILFIGWACSIGATAMQSQPISEHEIKPGALVFFHHTRTQKSQDLDQRAEELSMELACIMDPPFDSERRRVNIQKVLDPAVKVGVKPKHLTLAVCMFDDESALAPSPNQHLKLEIYKLPDHQKPFQAVWKQLLLADGLQHCDEAFLVRSKEAIKGFETLLQRTAKCEICVSIDPQTPLQGSFGSLPDSSAYLIQFLEKILNPSHLDKDTFDDFRELLANYVFSYYVNLPHDFFREIVDDFCRRVARTPQFHNPRSFKILRIIYRNLQRNQPTECPKLEVMRDDFVDFKMVGDMFAFIQTGLKSSDACCEVIVKSDN